MMLESPADLLAHHASQDAADAFVAWRKMLKKPLTERAARMIAKTLHQINLQGGCADEALDLTQEHGWQTIKPDWYWRNTQRQPASQLMAIQGGQNGRPTSKSETRQNAFVGGAARAS